MFHRFLIAMHGGQMGQQVLAAAVSLAKTNQVSLKLLRVMSSSHVNAPGLKEKGTPEYDRVWTAFESDERALLESGVATITAAGLTAESGLVYGQPGKIICEMAESWEADAIIMGRRQFTGMKELLLGSVSNYVVHHAPCSVFVIQGRGDGQAETPV